MVTAAKLPVLNPGEFELWKMRIEQYFLMTDYALWEVIVNGDSPPPKRTIDGVEQTYPPTTAEEKLARKNELKARGECYNCHKKGHFAKGVGRALRENGNKELVRRNVTVETTETKLGAQDGHGYDWSLEPVEARLDMYKKNEVVFEEDIKILKLDIKLIDNALTEENERYKTNEEYHVVPPPYIGSFIPPKYDLILADEENCFFVSFNHLIKDCDLYEKKMVEKTLWNNARMANHQNSQRMTHPHPKGNFVPKSVLMKSSIKSLNTAGQNFSKAAVSVNTTRPINTAYTRPTVNSGDVTTAGPKAVIMKKLMVDLLHLEEIPKEVESLVKVKSVQKNSVLFTDTACVVLSPNFKLTDESHVLLKVPKKDNMYSVDLKNVVPQGGLACLFAKAIPDESNLWHRRLGHVNFNTINKLVKGNLVRGLPSKLFEINQTCVACQKGKLHRASRKTKIVSSISQPLQMLHMDLFGPTFVKSLMKKMYCLVVTDDFSRCDNGTEFKNRVMNQFCEMKGIKREFSVSRTPQQNRVAKRKNRTLIEVARSMLADSKVPTTFWAEAVNTACYVQNRVLDIKTYNKTPYKLFLGRKPALSFMRPFRCPITILNTIDHLGKFNGKADEGFFIGYSTNSKAFRVFNNRTRIVEENLHVQFSENTPNIAGNGPNWLFDIDALTKSMNYKPVVAGNQSNSNAGTKACNDAGKARMETIQTIKGGGKKDVEDPRNEDSEAPSTDESRVNQENDASVNNTNTINTVSLTVNATSIEDNAVDKNIVYGCVVDLNMPELEDIVYSDDAEDVGAEAGMNNLDIFMTISPIPTTRIHKDHPIEQIIGDLNSAPQTKRMIKSVTEHVMFSSVQQRTNHKDFQNFLFACFLSQEDPKKTLMDLLNGKRAIGTKWVYRNNKDERGIVIKNKARLVAQGYTQEEGIDYDKIFALVSRIEAIRLFLAYASFKDFMVYQMDVKSAFLYGRIAEEVYGCQPPRFEDPDFPDRVYKVEKALYGLHQAPKAWYETLSTYLLDNGFQRGKIDKTLFIRRNKGLQVKQKEDGIFISQDKYVTEILNKFGFSDVKTASTPMETHKPLLKDTDGKYLKGQPKLGLWYPKDLPFDFVAYTDSDYAGASLDKKSTTRGCQFLGCRLISWQCKKQTVVANSITEAEYIAASNCCGQSTICIVKNIVFHSKTKHIEIRQHFIRDSNKKKLIQMIKIYTDQNVADLLTKAFDVSRL
ncbi:putative ribonuclease H-like domain-containing protein [Tanacetum coccineum]